MADSYPEESSDCGGSNIKSVIKELVRTRYCFPDIVLLVDKISIAKIRSAESSKDVEAYRLFLSDREKCIQAVLKRRLHKNIARDGLREGSHVLLKDYRLATGRRLNGEGKVQYLAISEFFVIGLEPGYSMRDSETESSGKTHQQTREASIVDKEQQSTVPTVDSPRAMAPSKFDNLATDTDIIRNLSGNDDKEIGESRAFQGTTGEDLRSSKTLIPSDPDETEATRQIRGTENKRKRDGDVFQQDAAPDRGIRSPSAKAQKRIHGDPDLNVNLTTSFPPRSESPWASKARAAGTPLQPIERPLSLSTLASVTGVNRSRNKIVDVTAVVESVDESTVKPLHLPLKRDIQIVDTSTDRKVTVSIFVDPVDCVPTVGEIVLFRNLVTHDYKQGALNAYPKYCGGKDWYIPNPGEGQASELRELKAKILATTEENRNTVDVYDGQLSEDHADKRQEYWDHG